MKKGANIVVVVVSVVVKEMSPEMHVKWLERQEREGFSIFVRVPGDDKDTRLAEWHRSKTEWIGSLEAEIVTINKLIRMHIFLIGHSWNMYNIFKITNNDIVTYANSISYTQP